MLNSLFNSSHMKIIKLIILSTLLLAGTARAQTTAVNTSINNLLTGYLELKNALAADNGAAAQAKAKTLNTEVTSISTKDMGAAQQAVWKNYVDKLSFDSRHISESTSIDHQREHFESLSKSMYAVLKAFKANSVAIYWQYCPMKKASWLSEKSTIENPYYGKEMPDCGSTKETLKATK